MTRTLRILTPAVAAALMLTGCIGGPASGGGDAPLTPTSRFSLQVEPGLDRIALAVHETGLSASQRAALYDLVRRFSMEGAQRLVVEAPAGGDPVANETAWRVKAALEEAGAPAHMVQVVSYAGPDPRAPVLAGFETVRAAVPQCGTSWTPLTRTGDNRSYSNFGCSVNANLAAQIENPRDIVSPRSTTPSSAARRSVVFDAYRSAQQTSAAQEPLVEDTRISRALD